MAKYGLIGKTLVHSYSKEIHEALGRYTYDLFSLTPEEMPGFIEARDFGGLNVTIPYKKDVIPLCDEVSDLAREIGAVNTLYWQNDDPAHKKLIGHNTDYEGFLYAAEHADIDFSGKTVLIMGTGGTSLTARKAAFDQGAAHIYIASRSASKVAEAAAAHDAADASGASGAAKSADAAGAAKTADAHDAADVAGAAASPARASTHEPVDEMLTHEHLSPITEMLTYEHLSSIANTIDVIVNTTPVGTYPDNLQSIIKLSDFPACDSVIDVIYNPFKTRLLMEAEKSGLKYSNGLPMLVAQATAAAGYFLGTPGAFYDKNERIIKNMQKQMQNIVLIGMPGSGKSAIGRILARKTGKKLVDTDEEVERSAGMSIPDIFASRGEENFRDMESKAVSKVGKERGLIISTGGGAVLRPENVDALRQNGFVIHVKRPVDKLTRRGRPLSQGADSLEKMEKVRLPIYKAAADITFDNSKYIPKNKLAEKVSRVLREVL